MGEKRRSFISALLVAVMCISLCACGKSGAEYSAERNIIVEELNGTSTVTSEDSGDTIIRHFTMQGFIL